jgi:uncharacterized protein YijF (DUF1287 family)
MSDIGTISTNRSEILLEWKEYDSRGRLKLGDTPISRRIPNVRTWVTKILSMHRTGAGRTTKYWDFKGNKVSGLGRSHSDLLVKDQGKIYTRKETVKAYADILNNLDPTYKSRLDNLVGDFIFDTVESVTHNTIAEPVYDIQTTAEQFTANGVIVHNCHMEHQNQDITKAKGVILDVFLRPLKGFAGNKHAKLIQLLAFDKTKDSDLCKKIEDKEINTVSIGIYYAKYACSLCGNTVSPTEGKPCAHTQLKVKTYMEPDTGRLIYRKCFSITAFETSVVSDPAYVSAIGEILRPSH